MQVVFVGAFDAHRRDLAPPRPRRPPARRIRSAASAGANLVDDHLLTGSDLALETSRGNRLLMSHEAMPALLFHRVGDGGRKLVGERPRDRLVTEAADAIHVS